MNRIVFLGTGGARIVVFKQIRASGGIWLELDDTNLLLDPGPGSLVRIINSKHKLDPTKLEAIILSHKHLDHSADVNVMIEAMTEGGFKKRGTIFAPKDAFEENVILEYLHSYVLETVMLKEGGIYKIGQINFATPKKHIHGNAETFGMKFNFSGGIISYVVDTRYFEELTKIYKADYLILNVVRLKPSNLDHLCIDDVRTIIRTIKPKLAILTHFGMTLLKAKPWEVAKQLSDETGIEVKAASDGMEVVL
ncbi:MAG: MBL fold metallo-hydrolase [Candidatus Edwardsbacteria bacterium]